jgi:hypothetical protein
MSEADHEYGPTPAGAGHEHSDIDPSVAYRFGVWLSLAMVISAGIVYGAFMLFEGESVQRDRTEEQFPLAAGRANEPPSPRLQTQPFKDVYLLRDAERLTLQTYGWVDRENQIVRLPIGEAMRLTLERGLPTRETGADEEFNTVVQDSSSGRTSGVR